LECLDEIKDATHVASRLKPLVKLLVETRVEGERRGYRAACAQISKLCRDIGLDCECTFHGPKNDPCVFCLIDMQIEGLDPAKVPWLTRPWTEEGLTPPEDSGILPNKGE
jgi:hypothetical protein